MMLLEFYIKVLPNTNDVGLVLIEAVFKSCINKLCFTNILIHTFNGEKNSKEIENFS